MRQKGEVPQPPQKLSEAFFVPERKEEPKGKHERIIVVSDLHGAKAEVLQRLNNIPVEGDRKPKAVILNGDVVGNPELEELQKLFYNGVVNHARTFIKEKEATGEKVKPEELLSYTGVNPPYDGFTLEEGFMNLRRKELELEGLGEHAVGLTAGQREERDRKLHLNPKQIADEILRYAEYVHYGHYVSNLPENAVKKLADGVKDNAILLNIVLKHLKDKDIKVYINEGNWDPSPPFAFKRGGKEAIRLSPDEQQKATGFSAKKFFEEQGVAYVQNMFVFETDTAAVVLLPFDQLVKYAEMDKDAVARNTMQWRRKADEARKAGKQVIVVQHGEVAWEPHNLTAPHLEAKGEHEKIIKGSTKINELIKPDEIIHGHFHDPFVDEKGEKQAIDTKYAVLFDNTPHIVGKNDHQQGDTVVNFAPLQHMTTLLIPYEKEKRIHGFGGTRQPGRVSLEAA